MITQRIDDLKEKLMTQNAIVKTMLEKSISGLMKKDAALLNQVIHTDEPEVNALEVEIDAACTNIIALYHPEAKDLRTVLMMLKMNSDFERMGDSVVNICESALYLIERPQVKEFIHIPQMAEETTAMLKDSIRAFIDGDVALARDVCRRDDIVDDHADTIFNELMALMMKDPSTIERSFHILRISHNLERIADHTTNIAEDVVFISEGKVIKHHLEDGNDPHRAR